MINGYICCDMHVHSKHSKEWLVKISQGKELLWYEGVTQIIGKFAHFLLGKAMPKDWGVYFRPGMDPFQIYKTCIKRGMDYVTITDHDCMDGIEELLSRKEVDPARVIRGVEITTHFNNKPIHVLVYELGREDFEEAKKRANKGVDALVSFLKEEGYYYALAHPFLLPWQTVIRQKITRSEVEELIDMFDVIELNGDFDEATNELAYRVAVEKGKRLIAGSDAHIMPVVGRTYVAVPSEKADSKEKFLEAVFKGNAIPVLCIGDQTARAIRNYASEYQRLVYVVDGKEKPLDFFSKGMVRGVVFSLIEGVVKLGLRISSGVIARWGKRKLNNNLCAF